VLGLSLAEPGRRGVLGVSSAGHGLMAVNTPAAGNAMGKAMAKGFQVLCCFALTSYTRDTAWIGPRHCLLSLHSLSHCCTLTPTCRSSANLGHIYGPHKWSVRCHYGCML
jgi:hypothetical protein